MLHKCTDSDKPQIFEYIGNDYKNCLYIYADLKEYSLNETFINTWFDYGEKNEIRALIFNYHTGAHIFSPSLTFNIEEVVALLHSLNLTMINARKDILAELIPYFQTFKYEYGYILCQQNEKFIHSDRVETALPSDYHAMAEMLCADYGIGASYTVDEMEKQIINAYGRKYVLRIDGNVAALAMTGAELDRFAIFTYGIVSEKYRRQGLGSEILQTLCYDLNKEGKEVFCACYEKPAIIAWGKVGFRICADWGKLYLESK